VPGKTPPFHLLLFPTQPVPKQGMHPMIFPPQPSLCQREENGHGNEGNEGPHTNTIPQSRTVFTRGRPRSIHRASSPGPDRLPIHGRVLRSDSKATSPTGATHPPNRFIRSRRNRRGRTRTSHCDCRPHRQADADRAAHGSSSYTSQTPSPHAGDSHRSTRPGWWRNHRRQD
jgi:hypothetical protein